MKEAEKSSHCRYVALDIHKHYSVVAGVDRDGQEILLAVVQAGKAVNQISICTLAKKYILIAVVMSQLVCFCQRTQRGA